METTYIEGVRLALQEEMRRDERVFLLGEDIGGYGGAFKATAGLLEEFGADRVVDTPIAEAGILGVAVGAALAGRRPVAEMQFMDFVSNGFQILTNFAAKCHYRLGEAVPMVVRGPAGGGVGAGPFHSQNVEAYFLHTAGLKIVAPSTAADARGLLKAAIRDPNPVVFLEHKKLYRHQRDPLPAGDGVVPLGSARIARKGEQVTVVTYGAMVHVVLEAAEAVAGEGIDAEVVDLRTLKPWDEALVLGSVRRTGKLLIVHEAALTGGVGAELAARAGSECFEWLDGPILRLAAADVPVPYHPVLEGAALPGVGAVAEQLRALAAY